MAVNCCALRRNIEGFAGVTDIDTTVGATTVRIAERNTDAKLAPIAVLPCVMLVANPALLMVATAVDEELQLTVPVKSCVLPLVYVPMAVNCWLSPSPMDGLAGVTAI